jgi:acetolactate synthase-1/2/3 large subunit
MSATSISVRPAAPTAASAPLKITVGELAVRFLEQCGTRAAFGVISIHNMPILDAFNTRRLEAGAIRFVSARGEAGACNMADAYARVTGNLGVCVTSTGTGAGNAAGALVEAITAGTPMLHLTGQIESEFLDRDLGFIHEAPAQMAMLQAVGKAAFRIRNAATALATLREAVRIAQTPPCGPVSVEIPIDVQASLVDVPLDLGCPQRLPLQAPASDTAELARRLKGAKRPLLWLGGGARMASAAVTRFVAMGWGVVTSVQGRGILAEDHPASLGSYNLQPAAEALYAQCDAMLVVGSRLRSNETLRYKLKLPQNLYRIDANALAQGRAYSSALFVQGDAQHTLDALAQALEGHTTVEVGWHGQVQAARQAAATQVDAALGPYVTLKNELQTQAGKALWWVRDITLSNSMWGNRAPVLDNPRAGVHALGGGIGQGLAMAIGVDVANQIHTLGRKTVALIGDGGFILNVGELACAAQERADVLILLMNDGGYGVIKNIQDDIYGSRHCYVDLHTPNFAQLCASMGVAHVPLGNEADTATALAIALKTRGPVMLEVNMKTFGSFKAKFAGPILKKD